MLLLEALKYKINTHDIISFDIFDTLLLRPYVRPIDLFLHIERLSNKEGFFEARRKAEKDARIHTKDKDKTLEDITLDDIYNEIDDNYKDLKQLEINLETQILQQNHEIFEVFEYAKQQNKKIILTSDMYLNKNILENILNLKGYNGYYKLYVSSDIKKQKATGNLYKYIINDLKVEGKDILHIGDNPKGDIEKATENNIDTFYYQKISEKFLNEIGNEKFKILLEENPNNLDISIILGMIILNWHNKENKDILNYWEDFGYNFGGPVCYGFTKFIIEEAKKRNISDLFFIARDGYTLNKIYEIIKGDCQAKNHYVYAPRILKILCLLDYADERQLDSLFKKFSELSPEFKNLLPERFNSFDEKKDFFEKNKYLLENIAENNKEEYKKYINSLNLKGNNIHLVDTIAGGFSAQKLIISTLKNENNISASYIRVTTNVGIQNNYNYNVYFDKNNVLISRNWCIFEFIITAPEFPIKGIENSKIVYQDNPSIYELQRKETYKIISNGELAFSKDLINIFGNIEVDFKCENIIKSVNNFCLNLSEIDEKYLATIYYTKDSNHSKYVPLLPAIKIGSVMFNKKNDLKNNKNSQTSFIKIIYIPILKVKEKDNKKYIKLLNVIPLLKINNKENKKYIKLFNILPLIKIKQKTNKTDYKLFNFIPLMRIKNK